MPELQSCYFCGTPENLKQYAVVPPRFADSEGDERTAVLCEQCKGKLMNVIQPLAEKLDAGEGERAKTSAPESSRTPTRTRRVDDGSITMNPGTDATKSATGEHEEDAREGGDDTPPNYRKVMRLLSNREFPMERHDVEELLGGAYDMEREEIDAVLGHAIESGQLAEEDETLTRV